MMEKPNTWYENIHTHEQVLVLDIESVQTSLGVIYVVVIQHDGYSTPDRWEKSLFHQHFAKVVKL